jgi:hypothetical protein
VKKIEHGHFDDTIIVFFVRLDVARSVLRVNGVRACKPTGAAPCSVDTRMRACGGDKLPAVVRTFYDPLISPMTAPMCTNVTMH